MAIESGAAVLGSEVVGVVPEVGGPLANVAVHVVQAEAVGGESADLDGSGGAGEGGAGGVDDISARGAGERTGAAGVLPLSLRRDAVALLGCGGEAIAEYLRYDAAGNVLNDGINYGCGTNAYAWNAEGQMTCAAGANYTYDGDGVRVEKTGGDATPTLYWGVGALAESNISGTVTSEYIFVNGRRLARRDAATGSVYYYLEDMLGSSNLLANANGTVENEPDFYPFGGELQVTDNLTNQHYKFTGKERDPETGLDNFGARYSNSIMGRFQSPKKGPRINGGQVALVLSC